MTSKFVTLLCYWGGEICDGPEGVTYNKSPSKAIKIHCGIEFNELINKIHNATSVDKQQNDIKVICRYPSVVGKVMRYIPLPVEDNADIEVMFDVFSRHQELSNIDLYLEVKGPKYRTDITLGTQKSVLIANEASLPCEIAEQRSNEQLPTTRHANKRPKCHKEITHVAEKSVSRENEASLPCEIAEEMGNDQLPTMRHANVMSDMIQNEDFNTISQIAVVNNAMSSGFDTDDETCEDDVLQGDETGDGDGDEDETEASSVDGGESDTSTLVPSNFTSIEGLNMATVDNWKVSYSESKNDLTRELGKDFFKDKEELIRAIKLYTIRKRRQYEVVETCQTIWKIKCKLCSHSGCKWKLRACKRKRSGNFEITQYSGPHTCLHYKVTQDHPHLDASLIAQEIQNLVKEQPSISVPALRAEIIDKLGYNASYKKVWVGKQKAIEQIFGNWEDSYIALPKFLAALQFFNPGTIVEWYTAEPNVDNVEFRRVFWAFAPSIKGFEHCRPVISVDATHFYGKYKEKMMIAMGVDGNNQILPLAFAIVENESYNCWNWFLSHVKKHVVKEHEGICLLSDCHSEILNVVNEQGSPWLEPHGFHRYCLRHFVNNFNDKFRNSHLKALAYRAGSQIQVCKFNSIMDEIGKLNSQARQWLEMHPLARWTLAHDGGKRYGLLTTNLSEIFNSVLKGARFLPITACVQLTFYRLVHYFDVRRSLAFAAQDNRDLYTPYVVAKQAASMSKASAHTLKSFNLEKEIYEVTTEKRKVVLVNLEKKTCTCGKWEVYKYPCSHVLSACAYLSLNNWQYVQDYYSIVEYCATWASEFSPLPREAYWPQSSVIGLLPNSDLKRKEKGRPRSTRLRNGRDIKEGKKAILCGICRQSGHNQKTCPKPGTSN